MVESRPAWTHDEDFDGGDLGCGYLLVDLKLFFDPLPSGRLVLVRWLSEAAPVEIPSWCWLTGHALLQSDHPYYLIRRR